MHSLPRPKYPPRMSAILSRNSVRALRCLTALALLCPAVAVAGRFQSARTLDGAPFNSTGAVTIVHYWATWCAPCRIEMPILDSYYRRHHAQGLEMLAISIDDSASARKLSQATAK